MGKRYARASRYAAAARTGYNALRKGYNLYRNIRGAVDSAKNSNGKRQRISTKKNYSRKKHKPSASFGVALQGISQHGDTALQKIVLLKNRPIKGTTKCKGIYQRTSQQIVGAGEGNQSCDEIYFFGRTGQIASNSPGSSTPNGWALANYGVFNLNPMLNNTGSSGSIAGALSSQPVDMDIIWEKLHQELTLTNFANTSATCWLYFFLTKKNHRDDSVGLMTSDLNAQAQTTNLVRPTVTTANGNAGTIGSVFEPGVFPNGRIFKSQMKQLGCRKFVLQAGDSRKFSLSYYINKRIKYAETINLFSDTIDYMQGVTLSTILITLGSPVSVTDASTNGVTTSKTKIGIMSTAKMIFSFPPDSGKSITYAFDSTRSNGATAENFINDVDVAAVQVQV